MISEYQSSKNKFIEDANVIFAMSDQEKDERIVFKSADREGFFNKITKQTSSFSLKISKKQT